MSLSVHPDFPLYNTVNDGLICCCLFLVIEESGRTFHPRYVTARERMYTGIRHEHTNKFMYTHTSCSHEDAAALILISDSDVATTTSAFAAFRAEVP